MKLKKEIKITETELRKIIAKAVMESMGIEVKKMTFRTGVRGDYDKGNAEEYVKEIICIEDEK